MNERRGVLRLPNVQIAAVALVAGCGVDGGDHEFSERTDPPSATSGTSSGTSSADSPEGTDDSQIACGSGVSNSHETWETCPEDCHCNFDGWCGAGATRD